MTDNELKELIACLSHSQKETDKQLNKTSIQIEELSVSQKETDKQLNKTSIQIEELSVSQKETDKQLNKTSIQIKELLVSQKETDRKLDKVAKMLGGIGANQGDIAEDFFYNSLVVTNRLGELQFDDVTKNMEKHRGKIHEEYDIFLTNGESIAIIEVKYKAHLQDVKKLDRKFDNFKKLFPIYQDYKLYGAMASFYFNQDTKDKLLAQGYFVLERCGDLIQSSNQAFLKVA